jgi:hypothetical protein
MSHPVGDIALNAAFVKALQAFFAHAGACTKGCELEPPKYCNKGFKLRTAQQRFITHVRSARRCSCAHGAMCDAARELDREADSAYRQVGDEG